MRIGIGRALLIAVAATMVSAQTAGAVAFHAESAPVTISGSQVTTLVLTVNAGEAKCSTATFAGSVSTPTSEGGAAVTPTYETCTLKGIAGATFTMFGCNTRTTWIWPFDTHDIDCQPNGWYVVHSKVAGVTKCTVKVFNQSAGPSSYTNEGSGSSRTFTEDLNLSGIKYEQTAGTGAGACKSESATNGTITGSIKFSGKNSEGNKVGIWVE